MVAVVTLPQKIYFNEIWVTPQTGYFVQKGDTVFCSKSGRCIILKDIKLIFVNTASWNNGCGIDGSGIDKFSFRKALWVAHHLQLRQCASDLLEGTMYYIHILINSSFNAYIDCIIGCSVDRELMITGSIDY